MIFGYLKRSPDEPDAAAAVDLHGFEGSGGERASDSLVNLIAPDAAIGPAVTVGLSGRPLWEDDTPATAESIGRAYEAHGEAVLARLNGAFAVAIADRRSRRLLLAIDRIGISALSWSNSNGRLAFSTSAYALARHIGTSGNLRPQALYDYFFFHMIPAPDSVFEGVNKIRGGEIVCCTPDGIDVRRYWRPSLNGRDRASFEQLRAELHEALHSAVSATRPGDTTGAFLSGGLDSSTVAGVLSRQRPRAHTFSIGFGVPEFDETRYARITSRHFDCTAHEYEVTPDDVVEAIPVIAASYDEPFGNSSAIPSYICARLAREAGITHMLAGDGGDELFGGNERYARQKVFEWYGRLPAGIRTPASAVVRRTIHPEHRITPLRKLRSYVDQALIPLPERLESWNFVYREGATVMFEPEFMERVDPEGPMRTMRGAFDSIPAAIMSGEHEADLLDKMLLYDWKFTLADNDLRKVRTTCAAAGIDVDFPMLDNRVVEMSLRVPSRMKLPRLSLRHFYRQAMRGFLADETLAKRKKGFGLPFGIWLKDHARLADFVYGSLMDLKSRRVVRPGFLDRLIEEHRQGHAGYYGYVIWDLVVLEEWLKRHSA